MLENFVILHFTSQTKFNAVSADFELQVDGHAQATTSRKEVGHAQVITNRKRVEHAQVTISRKQWACAIEKN